MTQTLSEQQLAGLLAFAQSCDAACDEKAAPSVEKITLGKRPPFTADQTNVLTLQSESFARNVSVSLSSLLRLNCEVKFATIDRVTCVEFLAALPAPNYVASLPVSCSCLPIFLNLDLPLALSMIDILIGGPGTDPVDPRGLTEIEEHILSTVPQSIAAELKNSWHTTENVDVHFGQREVLTELTHQPSLAEEAVRLTFTVNLLHLSGSFTLLLPDRFVEAMLRTQSAKSLPADLTPSADWTGRIRQHLLNSPFEIKLALPKTPIKLRELLALEPGRIILLRCSIQAPIELFVGGRVAFRAFPVRHGSRKGARIVARIPGTKQNPAK
jgi:flagellar motor switch protein FliM